MIYEYHLPDPEKAREYYDKYVQLGGDPAKIAHDTPSFPISLAPKKKAPSTVEPIAETISETIEVNRK